MAASVQGPRRSGSPQVRAENPVELVGVTRVHRVGEALATRCEATQGWASAQVKTRDHKGIATVQSASAR